MQIHGLDVEKSLSSLKTSAAGLAGPRQPGASRSSGRNRVEEVGRESLLVGLAREFTHFFAVTLWVGAALASWPTTSTRARAWPALAWPSWA